MKTIPILERTSGDEKFARDLSQIIPDLNDPVYGRHDPHIPTG